MRIYQTAEQAGVKPGKYLARCIRAEEKRRGRLAVLTFALEDSRFAGVALHHWLETKEIMAAQSKFARAYKTAGGNFSEEVSLDVFTDKLYVVRVGWRATDADRRSDPANAQLQKDESDFLRVHEVVSLYDDKSASAIQDNERGTRRRVRAIKPVPGRGEGGDR